MNYSFQVESGGQLLARLNPSKSAAGLDEKLFLLGPNPKETVELTGAPSTGKTLLMTQFIMKAILPPEYKNLALGGLNIGVIFIETDSHFELSKLCTLMERFIRAKMRTSNVMIKDSEISELIESALNNLSFLTCYSGAELFITFLAVHEHVMVHHNVSLVLVDSIAAFYYEDIKNESFKKFDTYCKKLVEVLQKSVKDFDVTIIYTKPPLFKPKNSGHQELSSEPVIGKINYRIELKFHESETGMFVALVQNSNSSTENKYKIGNGGIKWS